MVSFVSVYVLLDANQEVRLLHGSKTKERSRSLEPFCITAEDVKHMDFKPAQILPACTPANTLVSNEVGIVCQTIITYGSVRPLVTRPF